MDTNDRAVYIERVTGFLVPEDDVRSREAMTLDGIYDGSSVRIMEMIRTAYRRGIRRGAAAAFSARQPITLRRSEETPCLKPNA